MGHSSMPERGLISAGTEVQAGPYITDGLNDLSVMIGRSSPKPLHPRYFFKTEGLKMVHAQIVGNKEDGPVWYREFMTRRQSDFIHNSSLDETYGAQKHNLPALTITPSLLEQIVPQLYEIYQLSSSFKNSLSHKVQDSDKLHHRGIVGELMHESDLLFGAVVQEVTNAHILPYILRYRYGKVAAQRERLLTVFENIPDFKLPDRRSGSPISTVEQTRELLFNLWKHFYAHWVPQTFPQAAWQDFVDENDIFRDANILAIAWAKAYVSPNEQERMFYVDANDRSPLYRLRTRRSVKTQVQLDPYPYFKNCFLTGEFDGLTVYSYHDKQNILSYAVQIDEFKSKLFKLPQDDIFHDIQLRQLMLYGLMAQAVVDNLVKDLHLPKNESRKAIDAQTFMYKGYLSGGTTDRRTEVVLRMLDTKKAEFVSRILNVNTYRDEMLDWLSNWLVPAVEAHYQELFPGKMFLRPR
jgi:hypothetical protein